MLPVDLLLVILLSRTGFCAIFEFEFEDPLILLPETWRNHFSKNCPPRVDFQIIHPLRQDLNEVAGKPPAHIGVLFPKRFESISNPAPLPKHLGLYEVIFGDVPTQPSIPRTMTQLPNTTRLPDTLLK